MKKLTDSQKNIQKRMFGIIAKNNAKKQGWSMPPSYNTNWQAAMNYAIATKKVTMKKDGAWLVKKVK